ncbi:MAG: type II toxin-antitoxin system RelE/ParE family toxin [Bacteroidales bacterium]|nr:type II toxin-antitoxin system RelE/ParE family toxin [Bacteroidales bacterium]
MAKYDITKEAAEDLYRIWEYTVDTWSEKQADTYYTLLEAGMNEVADAPERIGKHYDEIYPGLRAYHVRRHMLFYILQDSGRVLIVRILHEKMDYTRHFKIPV